VLLLMDSSLLFLKAPNGFSARKYLKDQPQKSIIPNKILFLQKFCNKRVLRMMWQKYVACWASVRLYKQMPYTGRSFLVHPLHFTMVHVWKHWCLLSKHASLVQLPLQNAVKITQTHNVPYFESPAKYLHHAANILHLQSVDLLRSLVSQSIHQRIWMIQAGQPPSKTVIICNN
jgi:hypothetical protein